MASALTGLGDQHRVQPRVVSVSQSTELGTCYTPTELSDLSGWAHRHGLLLHLDGARLANAAAWLGCGLGDLGAAAGVDVLSFGATKNGAMGAEAVVVLRPDRADGVYGSRPCRTSGSSPCSSPPRCGSWPPSSWPSWRTTSGDGTPPTPTPWPPAWPPGWRTSTGWRSSNPCSPTRCSPPSLTASPQALQAEYPFYVWDESTGVVRWMASFDLTEADVDGFVARLTDLVAGR